MTKEYPDIKGTSNKIEEAAVYALPQTQSTQQATMDAIMLMFSTLDDESKRAIAFKIKGTSLILETNRNKQMTLLEAKQYLRSRRLESHHVPSDFNGMKDEVNEKYL